MRIATFNVLHGLSLQDGAVDLDRLCTAVVDLGAEVIGLQEVDRNQARSGGRDLAEMVAAAVGGEHRFAAALVGPFDRRWRAGTDRDDRRADLPAYGISLISRFPVLRWGVHRLPALPIRSPVPLPGTACRLAWLRDEPRVMLAAQVEAPGGRMTVATTHLSFVPGWNAVQLRRAVRALRGVPGPRLLLGDFNLPGGLPGWLTGWRALAPGLSTYPAHEPCMQLDHVLADGPVFRVVAARAWTAPLSDHRAVIVELER